MSALIDTAIARALALPCFTAPNGARALGGGITNVNIFLEDQGRRYVVRLGEDIPEHGVMRFNELAVSRAAHAAGVAPAVVHAAPGVLVLDHVDAAPLTEPEVRDHDPVTALVAERDGRADLETIIRSAPAFLAPGGLLALETGIAQHAALTAFAAPLGYTAIESKRDLTDRERFLLLRR